jgi:hypothetical protein
MGHAESVSEMKSPRWRMTGRQRACTFAILAFSSLLCISNTARAARIIPSPTVCLLESGYGIVAAEVFDAHKVNGPNAGYEINDVHFQVDHVVVQPVSGKAFSLQPGGAFSLQISSGYGEQLELNVASALSMGKRYYLIIRQLDDGKFELADGASIMTPVEKFDQTTDGIYQRLGALAAEPEANRLNAWVQVFASPTEPERLRMEVLGGIWWKMWTHPPAGPTASETLLQVWKDPNSNLSHQSMNQLDYVLRATNTDFPKSTQRCDVWLKTLLTLTPDMKKDDNNRDNLAYFILRDLGQQNPEVVAPQFAAQVTNKQGPALYRRSIAGGLLTAYVNTEQADPELEKTLQSYFVDLMQDGDPYPIRVAAGDMEYYATVKPSSPIPGQRQFLPDDALMAAMKGGVLRLTAASKSPGADIEYKVSARELSRVVQELDQLRNQK